MDNNGNAQRSINAILLLLIFAAIYFAKDLLLPIILGLLITLTLSPIVRFIDKFGIPSPISATAVIFAIGCSVVVGLTSASVVVGEWIEDAPQIAAEVRQKLEGVSNSMDAVNGVSEEVAELADASAPNVRKVSVQQPGMLNAVLSNAAGFAMSIGIGLVLALLLLASNDLLYLKITESMSAFEDKRRALEAAHAVERQISRYLLSITIVNAGLGVTIGTAMFALGLPYFYLWGIAAFLLNFLPYLGSLGGVILVGAFAIISFDSVYYALLIPLVYLVITTIEGQLVTPILLGRRLEVNSVAVFLSVIFWAWLWGVFGALIAVPLLVTAKVIADHIPALKIFANFVAHRSEVLD